MNKPSPVVPWVGAWLHSLRLKSNTPIEDVAAKLSMHVTTLRRRERGAPFPADSLPLVVEAYGATLGQYVAQAKRVLP